MHNDLRDMGPMPDCLPGYRMTYASTPKVMHTAMMTSLPLTQSIVLRDKLPGPAHQGQKNHSFMRIGIAPDASCPAYGAVRSKPIRS